MIKQISTALISAALLLNALDCSNGKVRAAATPPPPSGVEVAPVIKKHVLVQGEWVGTLEGYVNAQISPQVSGYLICQDYQEGALVKKGQVLFEIVVRRGVSRAAAGLPGNVARTEDVPSPFSTNAFNPSQ